MFPPQRGISTTSYHIYICFSVFNAVNLIESHLSFSGRYSSALRTRPPARPSRRRCASHFHAYIYGCEFHCRYYLIIIFTTRCLFVRRLHPIQCKRVYEYLAGWLGGAFSRFKRSQQHRAFHLNIIYLII